MHAKLLGRFITYAHFLFSITSIAVSAQEVGKLQAVVHPGSQTANQGMHHNFIVLFQSGMLLSLVFVYRITSSASTNELVHINTFIFVPLYHTPCSVLEMLMISKY